MRARKGIVVLSRRESRVWCAGDSEADQLGRDVRAFARAYLERTGHGSVEVYSARSAGGWVATVVHAPEDGDA
jgi:hypothetical protein